MMLGAQDPIINSSDNNSPGGGPGRRQAIPREVHGEAIPCYIPSQAIHRVGSLHAVHAVYTLGTGPVHVDGLLVMTAFTTGSKRRGNSAQSAPRLP